MSLARKLGAVALVLGSVALPAGVVVLLGPGTTCGSGCAAFLNVEDSSIPVGSGAVGASLAMLLGGAAAVRRAAPSQKLADKTR